MPEMLYQVNVNVKSCSTRSSESFATSARYLIHRKNIVCQKKQDLMLLPIALSLYTYCLDNMRLALTILYLFNNFYRPYPSYFGKLNAKENVDAISRIKKLLTFSSLNFTIVMNSSCY